MKTHSHLSIRSGSAAFLLLAGIFLIVPMIAWGHNLDQRFTYINLDPDTLDMMRARVAAQQPPVQIGDTIAVVLKSTPGPGTLTGVGGYLTFYLPSDDTFQVVGAEYLAPDPNRPGYYMPIPVKGQSIIAIGNGSIGSATTTGLVGLDLGPNINGVTEAAVTAAGLHRGTIAGVYADTGIFYSTSPMTMWDSWEYPPATLNSGARPLKPGGGQYPVLMTNNRGETIKPRTWWDASQLIGFGLSSPHVAATDPNGRGNAPWGTANVVAGPQSGYAWDFNLMDWVNAGFPGYSSSGLQNTLDQVGPWNRIQYPGSQVSLDQAGLISAVLGYAGVDASNLGYDLSAGSPLPTNTTAVRFSFGMLELGRTEVGRVYVKVLKDFTTCPFPIHGDAFGGDAGGEQGGKDHLWRYYDPTDTPLDLCGGLQKRFLKSLVLPGETVGVTLTYFNGSYLPAINMVVTDPLPSGMTYVAGTSKINGVTTPPLSTSPLTWNIGYVEPYGLLDITFDVVVTGTGDLLNTARAESNQGITYANDTIRSGANDFLVWDKYVSPSAVAPGGTVNYTVEISNIGTGPNGIPFVITEYLPAGFTYVSMVSKQINGGLLPDSLISINAANPNQPIFTINQGIQAGQALVLTFKVLVGQNVPPETYCNYFKMGFEGKVVASAPDACVNVGGGSIGDTIWRDWDGDGIQDELEEGIQGVTVSLYNDVNGNGVYDAGTDTLITSQVTDNTGFYNFEGLTDGMYVVVVDTTATGLVQHSNTGDPDGGTLNQAGVTLADNSGTDLIDFGYKPGGPGIGTGSIGDKVFEDKDGNGSFDGSDAGIPNVTVNLYEDTNGNGEIDPEDLFISATQSDASGNYLFSDLASGAGIDYIVDIVESDPDIAAYFTTQGKTYFATTAGDYSVLNLSGASLINDFGFQGVDPGSIGDTVFFDSNANGVYDLGVDIPLANVTVSLYYDANGDSVAQPEEYVDSRDTDASGQYTFDNLSPERYLVLVDTGDPDLPGGAVPVTQQYVVTLGSGQNYTTADFPFVEIFTKTVDKAFALPGDLLTYSINLNLPTDTLYQNLTICDPIPGADVSFVSASAGGMVDGGYTPVAPVNGAKNATSLYVEDQFTTNGSYSGSNGTATWASNWAETGDDGLANAGGILVAGNRLRIDFNNTTYSSDGDYVERGVNLSEVASASMTYTLQTNELDTGEYIYLEVKGSGTAWVLVDTVTLGTATGAKGPFNLVSILQAASPVQSLANPTAIRFRRGVGTGNDQIEFDNIRINYATPNTTTAIAVSPTQVGNGGALTVTMTVGSSAAMTGVTPGTLTPVLTDGAAASLLTGPTPASASIAAGGTAIFTWTYTMTDTASPAGTVKFTGAATGTITGGTTYAFASATSGTAQVIPGGSGTVCWNLGSHVLAQDGVRIAGAGIYAFRGGDIAGGPFWRYDPSSGLWNNPTDPADFGATVNGGGSLTTDGTYIYALQGDKTKTVKRYDPVANTWAAMPSILANVGNGGAIAFHAANGKLYVLRGDGQKTFYEFTFTGPLTGTWVAKAPVAANVSDGGSLVSVGNYLYALRGGGQKTFYRYDPATNTWLARANTPGNVDDGGSMVAVGNYIYAFQGKTATFWRYDITSNVWTTMTAAPGVVGPGAALAAIGNIIDAFRGNSTGTDTEFWRYNIVLNTWTAITSAPAAVGWGGALVKMGVSQNYETSFEVAPSIVSNGQAVTVTYTVRATENVSNYTPPASLTVTATGGASATYASGPSPSGSTSLTANVPKSFTYTYVVTAGTPPCDVKFSAPQYTSGTSGALPGGVIWPTGTSHNVIAVPTLTMQVRVVNVPAGEIVDNVAAFNGNQQNELDYCYVVADGLSLTDDRDTLLKISQDGTVVRVGLTGTTHIEALVFSPDYTKLYTTDRDPAVGAGSDRFGTLNLATGVFTPINRLANTANLLEGFLPGNVAANFSVADVDGMSFDPITGKLYAIARREGTNTEVDLLFVINPLTGLHVEDAFGPGKDYIPIRTDLMATPLYDIDDIAFDPYSGVLYGIANTTSTTSGVGDRLVIINPTTGTVTDIGRIQRATDNANIDDMEGLTFSRNGMLHAVSADASAAGMKDTYWIINPATAKASLTGYSSLNPIQTTPAGTETDFESVACYSDDLAISATDNAVTALKGSIGDLVWSDLNGDGNFDPSYAIIGGRIDIQNDGGEGGVINGNDDGVIGSIAVINGYLDLDGDGVTDGDDGDDGVFQGHTVLNGVLQTGTTVVAEQGIPNVRVYVDEDNDGVFDWTDTNGNGIWDAGEGERWEYTDASGLYAIYGMVSGAYTVRYDQSTTPSGYVPTTPVSHLATLATDVTQYADADFGLRPPLSPTVDSTIGDQVWIDRNEDGIYDTGEPALKDISVYLYLDRGTIGVLDAADVRIATDVTDAEGKYLFTGLSEDTYLVKVDETDPQFPSGLALVSASPAQPNPESVTLGTLQDKLDVDFAYNYTSSIGDVVWYDNNGNGLYEPELGENGVAGAYVMLYEDTNGNGVFDGDIDVQIGGTATTADGSYLLDNLPPGTYFVQVYEQSVRPEGCPTCVPNLMPTTATKVKVELGPNEAYLDADFGFKQGSIIEGSVFWDVNHNTVFEPQYPGAPEQGLGGITVWIDADGNGVLDWTDADSDGVWDEGEGEQWTVTDSDGSYKFFVGATGSYLVSYDINDPDIPPALQGPLAPTTATAQYVSITVLGEERTGIDFGRDNVGQIGDLVFGDRGVTGTYDGPATDPGLPYVVVQLYSDTDGNGVFDPSSDGYIGSTTTDANGAYLFPGLPDGTYFTKVLGESLPLAWSTSPTVDPTSPMDGVGKATVTGGGSVMTMDFGYPPQQPGSITGTVYNDGGAVVGDGELNVAIIDGYVDINRNGVSGLTDTADDGFFLGYQIIDGKVDVDGDGVITTADDIVDGSFDGKNVIDGMVDFNASGTITTADDGTLSADTALASVIINLYNASGVLVATTATDANGNYRFDGMPPGTYTVEEVTPTGFVTILDRAGKASDETGNTDVGDDLIPVTVTAGQVSANNNFLDDSDSTAFLVGLSGQVRNDVDADGDFTDADSGINGVAIRLFRDLNGDGVTPLLNVLDGQIDLNEDGVISAADTGTLFGLPIIGGSVDVNNDGSITTADDLVSFNGVQVIDGKLDIVPGGGITTADDGTIGTEPLVASTTTAGNGNYSFSNLAFGDYVVVETDLASAISTADVSADGINDNQIGVALSYGGETGRDFLDSIAGTVSGHLYKDTNGNGIQDGGEPNLTGVDVLIEDATGQLITVSTDSNGNWTASVPPGTTTASVVASDPQFLAVFPDGYTQTEGTNPTTVIAVGGVNTSMGNDGYFSPYTNTNPASIAGTVYNDADTAVQIRTDLRLTPA